MSQTQNQSTTPSQGAATPLQRAEISREVLHNIAEGKAVALAGAKNAYAPALLIFVITPTKVAQLAQKVADAEQLAGQVVNLRHSGKVETREDDAEKATLIQTIERIQTGAHLKYDGEANEQTRADHLHRYFIGSRLNIADSRLQTVTLAILEELKTETLPSVGTDEIQAVKDALADWQTNDSDAADAPAGAEETYARLLALNGDITRERRQIQIAANQAFSFRNPINEQARRDFHLPLHRSFI